MNLKHLPQSIRVAAVATIVGAGFSTAHADVSYYECADMGYISATHKTVVGTVATSNKGTEIMLVKDNKLQTLVSGPGAGMYVNYSKDGKLVGFKKIDNATGDQAPAVLDLTTGAVRLLESFANQCGQVSFADDGTMAYTVGNNLVIRKGDSRKTFNLGTYVNIANISPDATQVAYNDTDGASFILNIATGNIEKIADIGGYRSVWSPDGSKLAMQLVNGDAASFDRATRTIYPLGQVNSISWADNSQELVITRSERISDFQVKGAAVVKMNYKGADQAVLVDLNESVPVSAEINGNTLTVAYASGSLRGITATTYQSGIRPGAPAKVSTLFKAGAQRIGAKTVDNFMGSVRPDYSKMTQEEAEAVEAKMDGNNLKAPQRKGNDIGLTAIPYINQVWDTPACDGSAYAYGYICCAPTSSCMMLAWYGKFKGKEHWTASRSSANPAKGTNYSWFISKTYTSASGYTFNKSISGQGGYWGYSNNVSGGYGYMWGYGSPASMMANFHKNNGASNSYFASSIGTLRTECNANRPYIICLANGTGGHVVMVFRADQIAANNGSSAWAKTGSFVCHDPYGDYNSSSYPNWDGRYSSYDWPGYNNGRANIGAFYWGCVTVSSGATPTPTPANPELSVSPENVHFNCKVNEHPSQTVKVTAKNLTSNITVASITPGRFSVTPTTLDKSGGSFTIKFEKSDVAGTYGQGGTGVDYSFFVRVKSGSVEKVINITANVKDELLGSAKYKINERYDYSIRRNNVNAKGYDMSKIRNFCYKDGKLYCVYEGSRILVLNAQTGESLGFLSNGNVVIPAAATLADIKCINGVLVASNIAMTSDSDPNHTKKLRLYAWESDNAKPYLLFETSDFQGAPRMGDCLEMTGNFKTDCWFAFAQDWDNQTSIVEYNRVNGKWTSKKTPVLSANGKPLRAMATIRVYPKGSGWWIDGKNSVASWTTWDASKNAAVVQCESLNGDFQRGSCHHEFYWKGLKYAANLIYDDNNGNNGKMRIIQDYKGDFSGYTEIGKFPSDGLGNGGSNPNGTGDIAINTDGENYLEAWVLSTGQGLAYYSVGSAPVQNPAPVNPDDAGDVYPTVKVVAQSGNLTAEVGNSSPGSVKVEAANLRANITARLEGGNADQFALHTTNLAQSGTIYYDYVPTVAGSHSTTLVLSSQDLSDVRVTLTGTATGGQPTVTYDDEVGTLTEKWLYSVAKGNLAQASWFSKDAVPYTRHMAVKGNDLYVLNGGTYSTLPVITILNAENGTKKGELSCKNMTTGSQLGVANAIGIIGNDLYVVNHITGTTHNFRIYKYTNAQGEPALVLDKAGVVGGGRSAGFGANRIAVSNGVKVWYVDVNNIGDIKEITLEEPITNGDGGFGYEPTFMADGSFWITNKATMPRHYNAQGKLIETVGAGAGFNAQGSSVTFFDYGKHKYVAGIGTPGVVWDNGFMALAKVTNGVANAENVGKYPETFGAGNWGSSAHGQTKVLHQLSGNNNSLLRLWALVPLQGIGCWEFDGEHSSGVENIVSDENVENEPVEYYNLQGIRVADDNLTPGIYIRRQGNKSSKVYLR